MNYMKTKVFSIIALVAFSVMMAACGNKSEEPQNSMKSRPLGNTGIQVGEVGLGCAAFDKLDTAQSRAMMDVALDSGVNYIDIWTADPKVRGNIGYALQGRRDRMVIQGHVGCWWNGTSHERTRDVEKCQQGFEELLSLLGTDHIDVGMIHIVDNEAEWDSLQGTPYLDYVKQLKAEGKILHIGLSSHSAAAALKAVKSGLIEVLMFSANPAFDRLSSDVSAWDPEADKKMLPGIDPVRVELYDYCAQHGIGVVVMKAFGSGGGRLLDAEKSPLHVGLTVNQCLAYALAKPCVSTVVCGCNTIEELQSDLAYLRASDAEKEYSGALAGDGEKLGEGDCTYCNHCAPCPKGIQIARINELLDQAEDAMTEGGEVPSELRRAYILLDHHASECTKCGVCMSRCPFDVDVPARMAKAVEVFEQNPQK